MTRGWVTSAFVIVLTAGLLAEASAALLPADEQELHAIEASLKKDGPAQTLGRFFACGGGKNGYELVQTGDARAVSIAVSLLKSSDACVTELLMSSLATAMQVNPEAVLARVPDIQRTGATAETLCVPFIPEETSEAEALTILERSEQALLPVKKPALQKARQMCLQAIAKYRGNLARAEEARKRNTP